MSELTHQRSQQVDAARGLGILLVVLGHNWLVLHDKAEAYRIIYSFHVPLFLLLSGVFLNPDKSWGTVARARARTLLRPYFVLMTCVGLVVIWRQSGLAGDYILKTLIGTGPAIGDATGTSVWVPLWFLPHLCVTAIICQPLVQAARRWPVALRASLIVALSLVGLALTKGTPFLPRPPLLPFSADLLPLSAGLVLGGYLLGPSIRRMQFRPAVFVVALLAFIGLHATTNLTLDLNQRRIDDWLVTPAEASLGMFLTLALASAIQHAPAVSQRLAAIGTRSLSILIFHWPCQSLFFHALTRLSAWPNELAAAAGFVAGVLIPLFLADLPDKLSARLPKFFASRQTQGLNNPHK